MPDPTTARQLMVDSQLRARGMSDPRVLDAMLRVPRHEFVPEPYRAQAYEDHPLPIGDDQTISQPYIVALMLESLQLTPHDKVLDASLAESARTLLAGMGYANASVVTGDGALGLAACAPFDAILVSAAALRVPPALPSQLRDGGRMIIPIGSTDSQQLQFIRMVNGQPLNSLRELVRFVPLIPNQE